VGALAINVGSSLRLVFDLRQFALYLLLKSRETFEISCCLGVNVDDGAVEDDLARGFHSERTLTDALPVVCPPAGRFGGLERRGKRFGHGQTHPERENLFGERGNIKIFAQTP